jgi:dTDP-4-amino-4,6-dideoxygalactose transaminase
MSSASARIPCWNINVGAGAADAVAAAIRDRKISEGTLTREFEDLLARELGAPHVVCATSGTTALLMAFLALKIGPDDEIIMPTRTWVATAHAAMLLGAKIRPVDVKAVAPVIDEDAIEGAITERTRAIVAVSINGRACALEKIDAVARRHGLEVIEDACQALLSRSNGLCMGTTSRFSCFSLSVAKILATGQGGFITCRSEEDARLLRRLKNQGVFDVLKDRSYEILAGNFKFTDIQAALGISQVPLLGERTEHLVALYRAYREGLSGLGALTCVDVGVDCGEVPLRAEYLCTERNRFIELMDQRGIQVVAQAHCLHECSHIYAGPDRFPRADVFREHMVTLPGGPDQPMENVFRTIEAIREIAPTLRSW